MSAGAQELHALIADLSLGDMEKVTVFTVAGGRAEVHKQGKIEATGDGTVVVTNPYRAATGETYEHVTWYSMEHVVGVSFDRKVKG